MFWNSYSLETITFSDATLSDINLVLCYVLSQYQIFIAVPSYVLRWGRGCKEV
jgi:hypothetical protein